MSEWSKHRMNKIERRAYGERRARELAKTGEYSDSQMIEHVLRSKEGFSEAREWLSDEYFRAELDELCKQARQSKS